MNYLSMDFYVINILMPLIFYFYCNIALIISSLLLHYIKPAKKQKQSFKNPLS